MATLSNSSLSAWLKFNGTHLPTTHPCQLVKSTSNLTLASCAQVCNDSVSLFYPPTTNPPSNNLVTCGLWATVMSQYTYLGPTNGLQFDPKSDVNDLSTQFQGTGLNETDVQYLPSYVDTITDCLELIYINVKDYAFSDDGRAASACTRDELFPIGPSPAFDNPFQPSVDALRDCLEAICTPLTLNPDLAGIGVFSSFILQSGIAIVAFVALLSLESWSIFMAGSTIASKQNTNVKETHAERITIALVEFHKAQCYFSSVIQVTALLLFTQSKRVDTLSINSSPADTFNDFFDTSVLIVLATAGLIPVNLSLACLTRYGRQSWYLLILSVATSTLATATLISSYYYTDHIGKSDDYVDNRLGYTFDQTNAYLGNYTGNCAMGLQEISFTVLPLCGNSNLRRNAMPNGTVANWWTWLVWSNCIAWLFFCLGKKCFDTENLGSCRRLLKRLIQQRWLTKVPIKEYNAHTIWIVTAVIPWSLCFASQFWLFSAYFQHSVISNEWSFGQIIAITVWLPCLVEYIYIEWNGIEKASNYKYPSSFKVVKWIKRSSVMLTTLRSWGLHREDLSTAAADALLEESRRTEQIENLST